MRCARTLYAALALAAAVWVAPCQEISAIEPGLPDPHIKPEPFDTPEHENRFAYALSQIVWTHRDSGGTQFNYSEWIGNSTAVAISSAYYRDQRDVASSLSKLAMQIGVDAVGNVLKEFWPDLQRKFGRKTRPATGRSTE